MKPNPFRLTALMRLREWERTLAAQALAESDGRRLRAEAAHASSAAALDSGAAAVRRQRAETILPGLQGAYLLDLNDRAVVHTETARRRDQAREEAARAREELRARRAGESILERLKSNHDARERREAVKREDDAREEMTSRKFHRNGVLS